MSYALIAWVSEVFYAKDFGAAQWICTAGYLEWWA